MIGDQAVLRASQWCYQGVWNFVTFWLYVPEKPPKLCGAHDSEIVAFRPAEGYLRYAKLFFWIGLVVVDLALLIAWILLLIALPIAGVILAPLFWIVIIVPDILVYIGIHLRYDTTWYVLSDRTMRIRRGIWIIHEVTITYENIQNVSIRQGPIQRMYGISDIVVQTAGGGQVGPHGEKSMIGHEGVLEGIDQPVEIRDLIMAKWRTARSAGLGDDRQVQTNLSSHQQVLLQIRDLTVRMANA